MTVDLPLPARLAPAPIAVSLFGECRMREGDADVTPRGRKTRALLAYLAIGGGRAVSRDRVAELLWSDRGEEQARASLRQTLTELRSGRIGAIGAIEIDRESLRLAEGAVATDVGALIAATRRGDLPEVAERLEAMDGAFLAGLDGLSPGFDDWLLGERVRQHDELVGAVMAAAEAAFAAGRRDGLSRLMLAIQRFDPGNEPAARLAMRLAHAVGDMAALQRRHDRHAEQLRREYGVKPSAETRALFEALRDASAPEPAAPPSPMPARVAEPAGAGIPLLQIAPFVAVGEQVPAHLAEAIRTEVLTGLSRYRDLRLGAGGAAEATSDYLLVASLRETGGGLSLNPQLRRGGDGKLVWAERFELPRDGLQAAIDRMIGRVVAAVEPALTTDATSAALHRPTASLYARFLAANHAAQRPADHRAACAVVAELEAIHAEDPGFIPPMLALARLYDTDFWYTRALSSGPAERGRALELSRLALSLDRENVRCWTHMAFCHLWQGHWEAASRHLDSALTLTPFSVPRLLEISVGRMVLGELDAAGDLLQRSLDIDPRASDAFYGDRALLRLLSGDHDGAAEDFEMVSELDRWMSLHAAVNAALAGHAASPHIGRARERLAPMWESGAFPDMDGFLAWARATNPFRNPAHWTLIERGCRQAFG